MSDYSTTDGAPWEGLSGITAITVAGGVTKIGRYAFWGLDEVTSVTLNNGLNYIGDYAFSWCSALTELVIPSTVDSIIGAAFNKSGIQKLTFKGNSVPHVGEKTFQNINLKGAKIYVPEGFTMGGVAAVAVKTGAAPAYNNQEVTTLAAGDMEVPGADMGISVTGFSFTVISGLEVNVFYTGNRCFY